MKHSRVVKFGAALLALALPALPALAQENPAAGAPQPGHFLKCLTILGLSDAQKAEIRQILETAKPVLQGLHETLKTDAQALKAALEATPPDPCAIGTALLKVKTDRTAIKAELETVKTNVEAVLTPEQKAKFEGCLHAPPRAATTAADEEPVEIE